MWKRASKPPLSMREVLAYDGHQFLLAHFNYSKRCWYSHDDYEPVSVSHWDELPPKPEH